MDPERKSTPSLTRQIFHPTHPAFASVSVRVLGARIQRGDFITLPASSEIRYHGRWFQG
jgi:hypothetical protein